MKKVIANREIDVNEEGYLLDFSQWSKEIGEYLAEEQGISMSDKHWEVIKYLQDKQQSGEALSIRGIKKSGVIDIKEFYNLFPGGPLKKSTLIAGIPKPKSCI
ncbi:TusE/DsrC/DsvC family sulfur relay protein [Lentiprolixibacter aurantiacus]|uniref:TusE/DsrC/DsvC family sulfur relay protein n=1 Tax=Lentiprolixibacter aurantiacus TaxID=2993939 RepID=A0AAE3MM47_9FLAO|nr:TusE/DsrC/DsvC family sulfur relay protein [Lentiprolixibacter aurantiacus]MCX2720320.1 TusE/DsrC/DsvC family sulfur relay protein [Lentiprolixibacter aurantiacus]